MTDITIVLTGSIRPAVNFVAVSDAEARRAQYLAALSFYARHAPVHFLENSTYPLLEDADFTALPNVTLRKFAMLPDAERGKGYQEFAMLDAWLDQESPPPARFLKITGRYLVMNVAALLCEIASAAPDDIIIDRYRRGEYAATGVFSASRESYRAIHGLYRQMDDAAGIWAELVLYRALQQRPQTRNFRHEPDLRGISGSTGGLLDTAPWKRGAKQLLRDMERLAGRVELSWRGPR